MPVFLPQFRPFSSRDGEFLRWAARRRASAFKHPAACQHAGAVDPGFVFQLGEGDRRVFVDQVQRILLDGRLDGLQDVVAGQRQDAADDDQLRIENADQPRYLPAQLLPDFLHDFDAEQVFLVYRFDNLVQAQRVLLLFYPFRQDGFLAVGDSFQQNPVQGRAGGFRLQAALLAAVAEYFVVEHIDVAELSRESGLAGVDFPVDDDADAQSPADVHEDDVFLSFHASPHVFAIGHGPGVVVDADRASYFLGQDFCQRAFREVEAAEAVAGFRVDPSGDVDADVQNLLDVYFGLLYEGSDQAAQFFQRRLRVFKAVGYVCFHLYHVSFEVDEPDVDAESLDVHSDEIARFWVQPVSSPVLWPNH